MESKDNIPIAVIGMGCRFSGGANGPEALWSRLIEGQSAWTEELPQDRLNLKSFYHPNKDNPGSIAVKGAHFLSQPLAAFDASFFGMSSIEAEDLDPQQRIILEVAWEAVENAGITMNMLKGSDTAVFVGMFAHDFEHMITKDPLYFSKYHNTGSSKCLIANQVSYRFDLHGPSVTLDTGCSGSLVAINSACQSLKAGEAKMALAGGVGLIFSPDQLAVMSKTGMLNSEGKCFAFDDRGDGFGRGEGAGVVLLKPLSDAINDGDNIRAVIHASGVNQDGKTNGITLPSQEAQESLARRIFKNVPFNPCDVQYVEAHGTGTKAGDSAEMHAISNVFCDSSRDINNPLFVGTIKPNLGHTEAASGAAGLIKTILALEKESIPPNILLKTLKPSLADLPWEKLRIPKRQIAWPSTHPPCTRKAVVNSFGSGGTNAMIVLESAESVQSSHGQAASEDCTQIFRTESPRLVALSAKSQVSLMEAVRDLQEYLQLHPSTNLNSLSLTLASRRSTFPWRYSVVVPDVDTLGRTLRSGELTYTRVPSRSCNVFVFTGQGAQYHQMGYHLLSAKSAFSESMNRSDRMLRDLGASWSLIEELSRSEKDTRLNNSIYGQPASTAVQLGLVELLQSWNVRASAVIGHSSGEIAAAFAAGILSQSEALRIAYERSFLAAEAKKNASQSGSMMAVGLGEDEMQQVLDEIGHANGQAAIACINSPSSTTVSGDSSAIVALKTVLHAKGVFAHQLKVDTAYHSHHMQTVSESYLSRLEGLLASHGPQKDSDWLCDFFSTVSGAKKTNGFGPSYWVENLVSPVRFADAVRNVTQSLRGNVHVPLNFIEIGPHRALGGPIRQSVAPLQSDGLSYRYIPTLVRGENSHTALLHTGEHLIKAWEDIDLGAVARLGMSLANNASTLIDLPSYHWDHTTTHWRESRLSKEYRFRKHANHDLLGLRLSSSPDSLPSWRLILRRDDLPWLQDHVVDNSVLFPGSGYIAMAIEAIRQLSLDSTTGRVFTGYRIKNVSFTRSLIVPDDSKGVEVLLSFSQGDHPALFSFRIHSVSEESSWVEHCDGMIEAVFFSEQEEFQTQQEELYQAQQRTSDLQVAKKMCSQIIDHCELYSQLKAAGNFYGPAFAAISEARLDLKSQKSLTQVIIPDIAAMMPSEFIQPHIVHPTSLDAILHISVLLSQRLKVTRRGSSVPVFIGEIFISSKLTSTSGTTLDVVCDLKNASPHSSGFDIVAYHEVDDVLYPVVTISDGEIRVISEATANEVAAQSSRPESLSVFRVETGLDINSLSATDLEALIIPIQVSGTGFSQVEKVSMLQSSAAQYIRQALNEVQHQGLIVEKDYRSSLFAWMQEFVKSEVGRSLLADTPDLRENPREKLSQLGIEGEILFRMGSNMSSILTGNSEPLALLLEDNFLYRVYENDECARGNRYLAEYVKHLAFKKPGLRILELGAGTGSATLSILQVCSPDGRGTFCSEYIFTDISSGFFESAREKFKQWDDLIRFEALDLESDPIAQGFERNGFDIVLASNVIHATKSIDRSLHNIRQLLRPGGVLALVEIVKVTPFHNATFGMLPGWWAGVEDGRKTSPLQTVEQWDKRLRGAKFSGVELTAHDFPEPATGCALLTSRSAPELSNGVSLMDFELFNCLEDESMGKSICQDMRTILERSGNKCFISTWQDDEADSNTCPVVIDAAERPVLANCSEGTFTQLISLFIRRKRVCWITFSTAIKKTDEEICPALENGSYVPGHGLITGLARTALSEYDGLELLCVNVQDAVENNNSKEILDQISKLLLSLGRPNELDDIVDTEYTLRNGRLFISRLSPNERLRSTVEMREDQVEDDSGVNVSFQKGHALKLQSIPGVLSSLKFVEFDPVAVLDPDDVEVQPFAWGVNFKDVLVALGSLKATQHMAGECAGVVTRVGENFRAYYQPGQRVAMIYGTPPYSNRVVTNGNLIHTIPNNMSFADAATIPVAFATAYYGLVDCANLSKGQTVLIHAASGGLGQAAIMICQWMGATVFATVGSKAKKQVLIKKFGIPDSHIFSSRNTDFKPGLMRLTKTRGVDVVLNSLPGEGLRASWECVARMGAFIEVGKTDIYRRASLPMEVFDKNVRFVSVDFVVVGQDRPQEAQSVLSRVFDYIEAGHFSALPIISFPISEIFQAFRLLQSRQHTGKIVLEASEDTVVRASLSEKATGLDPASTYLIVGGLGSLGRQLCRHMQTNGARHIVLLSRKDFDEEPRRILEQDLAQSGCLVKVITCDILIEEHVKQMVAGLRSSMPPLKGVIHGAMVIADSTLPHLDLKTFQNALLPKYDGTNNLCSALESELPRLQFFIMLSSLATILGLPGQANYSAGNAYQDHFVHSQVSKGFRNFFSINLPLIKESQTMSSETENLVARKGVETVPVSTLFSLLDYAMSGEAAKDGNNHIVFGISANSMQTREKNHFRITPLLRPVVVNGQKRTKKGSSSNISMTISELLANATSMENKIDVILLSIKAKVSSLIALEAEELSLDAPVASLGLDSLVSIELKNWITKTLNAALQTTEIMDSPSLRSLAVLAFQRSSLVNEKSIVADRERSSTHESQNPQTLKEVVSKEPKDTLKLPKYPLHTLEKTMEVFLDSVAHLGTTTELEATKEAVAELLEPGGIGQSLHARLERRAADPNIDNWLIDTYNKSIWLQVRDTGPRGHNFFGTHTLSEVQHSQAERASLVSLAAYEYKLSLDDGTLPQDYRNELPLCMETVHWLFNAVRIPQRGCDRVDRWPGNEYLVAMRRGHVWKVPLVISGRVVSHKQLKATFEAILKGPIEEDNRAPIFTTGNRDVWAKNRDELISMSPVNQDFISAIEKSLFAVCLEDNEAPSNPNERGSYFLFDDNSNRWLDKTVSFIVCTNGVSASFYEHAMIDGSTLNGLAQTINKSIATGHQKFESEKPDQNAAALSLQGYDIHYTYMPFISSATLDTRLGDLQSEHLARLEGYSFSCYIHKAWSTEFCRSYKLPPKSVFQMIIQVAVRRHFGYSPLSWDMVVQRQFLRGRFDNMNVQTAEVAAFCEAAWDEERDPMEKRRLFLDAVRSHARFVMLSSRGRGWMRHLMALQDLVEPGNALPRLYSDALYLRTKERKVFTSFGDSGVLELGCCWADREALWISCEVDDNSVNFCVVNGQQRAQEFVGHVKAAINLVKDIIETK
ncbi:hypothetical protein N0V93_000608 [Gnomoniopsis smithogilvyi]|uniref:Carrier domain-containing protein n=1 Tax=Gnomoniopsis smithogilvyi TaxID=1191159 RepID=A0A9W8Z3Z2_9PEZI|nr:hypothetical protein N0V93_000608 [Gnomoniopsis smithogilvyi]